MIKNCIKMILNYFLDYFFSRFLKFTSLDQILLGNFIFQLHTSERFKDEKRLLKYEYSCFSQYGEDGIIHEIFNRIGITNKFFVEFGGNDGYNNNTTNLLFNGWAGLWIESDKKLIEKAKKTFKSYIYPPPYNHTTINTLKIEKAFLNINNIETIFEKNSIPIEFDLLSIDVDFNDYYLWEAINLYKPRVVIIEYNSSLGQHNTLVVPYKRDKVWDGTGYFGSSLKALENLGIKKGYSLVGCNSIGSNAFFVRSDIVKDLFCSPYTSENHFEPRFLVNLRNGHPKKIAEYINLDNKY